MALPVTTLFPLAQLPSCAGSCGQLFDANGACVPPHVAVADDNTYANCFCKYDALQAFSTGTAGVCDTACTTDPAGLPAIQAWFTSFCSGKGVTATTTSSSSATSKASSSANKGGGTWISTHWQWVLMLAIMIIVIAGGWVLACVWRRRYLARRDRQYALGKSMATQTASGRIVPNASQAGSIHAPQAGMFDPASLSSAAVYDTEKWARHPQKERKKWVVTERT